MQISLKELRYLIRQIIKEDLSEDDIASFAHNLAWSDRYDAEDPYDREEALRNYLKRDPTEEEIALLDREIELFESLNIFENKLARDIKIGDKIGGRVVKRIVIMPPTKLMPEEMVRVVFEDGKIMITKADRRI